MERLRSTFCWRSSSRACCGRGSVIALWRQIHWLAYASWPVALVHALGTGSDARAGFMQLAGFASLAVVVVAVLARVAATPGGHLPVLAGTALTMLIASLAIVAWYQSGPATHGWAKRAGTPAGLLAGRRQTTRQIIQPVRNSFSAALDGHITESTDANGLVDVVIAGALNRGRTGVVRIDLRGQSFQGGVSMTASGVSYVPAGTRTVYNGSVTTLDGQAVVAQVAAGIDSAAPAVQSQHRRGFGHRQRLGPRRPGSERMTNGRLLASMRTDAAARVPDRARRPLRTVEPRHAT